MLFSASVLVADTLSDPMKPLFPSSTNSGTSNTQVTKPKVIRKAFPVLNLDAISIVGDYKVAIINGARLNIGSSIKGAKLLEIRTDLVIFLYQGKKHILEMKVAKAKVIPINKDNEGSE